MPKQQSFKSLFVTCALTLLQCSASAQPAQPAPSASASSACYEMIPADANTLPGSPMLINKCTGETYVLTRAAAKASGSPKYRWLPVAMGDALSVTTKVAPTGRKCFSFDGRQFCP